MGVRMVSDKGSGVKGDHIDIYMSSHQKALEFGRQTRSVLVVENPPNVFSFENYKRFFLGEAFNVGQEFVPVGKIFSAASR